MSIAPMQAGSILPMVNRTYSASHPFQWARELVVNSIQAGATRVDFSTEWQAAAHLGVHRRMVTDNGKGIPRQYMEAFLSKYGGSGKTIGDTTENYGVGLKSSTLPWNKYGLVAISRHQGEESLMWLQHDPDADGGMGTYGARMFDIGTESGVMSAVVPLSDMGYESEDLDEDGQPIFVSEFIEDGVDWTKVFPGEDDGFCVVLLGDVSTQHTVLGDPNRTDESSKYGIVQYLNSRFWKFPEGFEVWVNQYENWGDQSKWHTSVDDQTQRRQAIGLHRTLLRALKRNGETGQHGSMQIAASEEHPGGTLAWALTDTKGPEPRGDTVSVPMIGLIFSSHEGIQEVFDLRTRGLGNRRNYYAGRMNRFVKVSEVRDRLSIIIRPESSEGIHIFPDQARTGLKFESPTTGGRDLDWDHWMAAWHQDMPEEIRAEIEAYYRERAQGNDGLTDEDYKRLAQRYLLSLKRKVLRRVPDRKGDRKDPLGSAPAGGTRRGRRVRRANPAGPAPRPVVPGGDKPTRTREQQSRAGMVKVVFDSQPDEAWAVSFDVDNHSATVNQSSHTYRRALDTIREATIARRGELTEAQEELVVGAVNTAMQAVVSTCLTEVAAEIAERPGERDVMSSDHAVSTILMGIMHIESVASGYIGTALSPHKRKSA